MDKGTITAGRVGRLQVEVRMGDMKDIALDNTLEHCSVCVACVVVDTACRDFVCVAVNAIIVQSISPIAFTLKRKS